MTNIFMDVVIIFVVLSSVAERERLKWKRRPLSKYLQVKRSSLEHIGTQELKRLNGLLFL